jgi:hypothetical protein
MAKKLELTPHPKIFVEKIKNYEHSNLKTMNGLYKIFPAYNMLKFSHLIKTLRIVEREHEVLCSCMMRVNQLNDI